MKRKVFTVIAVMALAALAFLYAPIGLPGPYHGNSSTIGEIKAPSGYERIAGDDPKYTEYLRSIPLKDNGTPVMKYTAEKASAATQARSYAVLDIALLSNAEQCADAAMHLRADYLFRTGQYGKICFHNYAGLPMKYLGGRSGAAFKAYLRSVFNTCNTTTLVNSLENRDLKDIQPGDAFIYKVIPGHKYGHAIMVVDVAENPKNGKRMFLLAEGSTPACDIHILRNLGRRSSPWFYVDGKSDSFLLTVFTFHKDELWHF